MPGRKPPAVSLPVPDWRLETGSGWPVLLFLVHLASHSLKARMNFFFSAGPKEKKCYRYWDLISLCSKTTQRNLFLRFFFFFPVPETYLATYQWKEAGIQMYSAYIQTLCCLPFIAGVVWWFAVTQMSLTFLQSCYYTVVQINCKARFILGKFWVPWNKTACMLLYNSVDLLSKEAGTLIFLSTVVKKSCSVDKFSMCLV